MARHSRRTPTAAARMSSAEAACGCACAAKPCCCRTVLRRFGACEIRYSEIEYLICMGTIASYGNDPTFGPFPKLAVIHCNGTVERWERSSLSFTLKDEKGERGEIRQGIFAFSHGDGHPAGVREWKTPFRPFQPFHAGGDYENRERSKV